MHVESLEDSSNATAETSCSRNVPGTLEDVNKSIPTGDHHVSMIVFLALRGGWPEDPPTSPQLLQWGCLPCAN